MREFVLQTLFYFAPFIVADICITLYRFVRFVSTPEVLERVYTLESEILQIEEAIAIQGNNETTPSTVSIIRRLKGADFYVVLCQKGQYQLFCIWQVEESPAKPTESIEGTVKRGREVGI